MGLELDYRKYFDSPFSWTGDGRLFVAANYTWSDSKVQVGDGDLAYTLAGNGRPQAASELVQDGSRLQGQSRSEEHTSELQSLMRISYAVFCLKKTKTQNEHDNI